MKKIVSSVLLVSLLAGAVPAASSCAMPTRQGVSGFFRGTLSFLFKAGKANDTEESRQNMRAKARNIRQDLYERFGYVRDGLRVLQAIYAKDRRPAVQKKFKEAMKLNKYMEECLDRVYQDTLKGLEVDLDKEEKLMRKSFNRSARGLDNIVQLLDEYDQY